VTVRLAIIGCGTVARRTHLPALKRCEDVEVVAFASRTPASAEAAASEWGGGVVIDDWRDVVTRDDIDAVDVCSPNYAHRKQAVAAARAGKHVLVEKPMAHKLRDADKMIDAAREAGVVLHVAHNLRHLPAVVAARDAVGRVGKILAVRHAFGHSGPQDWAPDATWFFDPERSGGGALIDLGIHSMDLVRFITGLEATHVSAMLTGDGATEDAAFTTIRFAGGAVGVVHSSWVARPAPDFAFAVYGTDGMLALSFAGLTFRSATGEKETIEPASVVTDPCAEFVRAIRGEDPVGPVASAEDGRAGLAIVSAAYESARTGKAVEVS
jgi:predicted dehydrogenase